MVLGARTTALARNPLQGRQAPPKSLRAPYTVFATVGPPAVPARDLPVAPALPVKVGGHGPVEVPVVQGALSVDRDRFPVRHGDPAHDGHGAGHGLGLREGTVLPRQRLPRILRNGGNGSPNRPSSREWQGVPRVPGRH